MPISVSREGIRHERVQMLGDCDAFWLAPAGRDEPLQRLAEEVGLRAAARFGTAELPGPIRFYLIDQGIADEEKRQFLEQLRSNSDTDVRFAPVLVVADHPPGAVFDYRRWGFDGVVVLPADGPSLVESLTAHLNQLTVYYETATYLGPDRRGQRRGRPREIGTQASPVEHRFIRDPLEGTRLVNPVKSPMIHLASPAGKTAEAPRRK